MFVPTGFCVLHAFAAVLRSIAFLPMRFKLDTQVHIRLNYIHIIPAKSSCRMTVG